MMYVAIIIVISFIAGVYMLGLIRGVEKEKGKQNEKELETVKRACDARTNADIDKLREKFKRSAV